jgi:hypothetical protein
MQTEHVYTSKLNPDTKQKWLTALRSNEYTQIAEYLHTDHGYCCLGVLCEIIPINVKWVIEDEDECVYLPTKDGQDVSFSTLLLKGGLCHEDMTHAISHLIRMNDSGEYSFAQIANWIEATL